MIPDEMTAIAVEGGKGPPEALKPVRIKTPKPGPGPDPDQGARRPASTGPTSSSAWGSIRRRRARRDTMGLEVAGEVAALGDGAPRWKLGDQVTALLLAAAAMPNMRSSTPATRCRFPRA